MPVLAQPLLPPCAYMGGKRFMAPTLRRMMAVPADAPFYDLCCGAGSVSLEMVSKGRAPESITMVDGGPWGLFWREIGAGTYDLDRLLGHMRRLPADYTQWQDALKEWVKSPWPASEVPYVFPILQAACFGATPLGWDAEDGLFTGFSTGLHVRLHKHPTGKPTSLVAKRKAQAGVPLRNVYERTARLVRHMRGVTGVHAFVQAVTPVSGSVVYIDPPYEGTSGYRGLDLNVTTEARRMAAAGARVYVSEGKPLNDNARRVPSRGKAKVNGKAFVSTAEWLSLFGGAWR